MGTGAPSSGINWSGHNANHSSPSSTKARNEWSYDSIPPICFHGVYWDFTFHSAFIFVITVFHSAIIFVIITTVSTSAKCQFVYVQDKNIVTNDSCT